MADSEPSATPATVQAVRCGCGYELMCQPHTLSQGSPSNQMEQENGHFNHLPYQKKNVR